MEKLMLATAAVVVSVSAPTIALACDLGTPDVVANEVDFDIFVVWAKTTMMLSVTAFLLTLIWRH